MAVVTRSYRPTLTASTDTHPSLAIWGDCPLPLFGEVPGEGYAMFEDFRSFGKTTAVSSNVGRYAGDAAEWISYEDNSCTITAPVQTTPGQSGIALFTVTTSAEKAAILEYGYGTAYSSGSAGPFLYTDGVGGKLWFEARVSFSSIAANSNLFFVGLAQTGTAVVPAAATSTTTLFDSTAGVGNVDLLGFDILSSGPSAMRCVYGKNGSARTSAGAAQTVVASTFYKIGFVIDPFTYNTNTSGKRKKMRWFVNGLEQQSLTDTSTSPFPTAASLTPVIHFQSGSGTAGYTMSIDWIRAAQIYPT